MPKTTLPVTSDKLAELARDSVDRPEPRALGSDKMRNVGADDARPTTQMDPAAMRALIDNAVPPIDELGTQKHTAKGMEPIARPPSAGDVVELSAEDRKSRKQRALEKPAAAVAPDAVENAAEAADAAEAAKAAMPRSTLALLLVLAVVSVVALAGWLR
ncbi:MAG: hypothetical protein JO257_08685 [Deltaproteobacteria bacterium]|nr:hypothetical protein [Deltaproteobacteria bacterium]